ncbi:MAG: PAS domain S-box protein [Gammaproteobacteria bacterium]|nr:PAS domain S-box protein [Gammaproteobacteria bacterium]
MLSHLKLITTLLPLWLFTTAAHAALLDYFKDEQGGTKWQYVANFSSGVLIILLTVVLVNLLISQRRAYRANRKLERIREELELRVTQRTATLNEYNHLLKDTNRLLEGEIAEHRETTSRLQSSEAYIHCILESMPMMLIGLNQHNTITHWNKLAEQFSGVASTTAMGKNLWEVYPAIPLESKKLTEVVDKGKPVTIKHCQRGQYYYEIIIYPLRDTLEVGVVLLIDDVTQRKLSENRLIQRDKMASMGELASAMAHDIELPLKHILKNINSVAESLERTMMQRSGGESELPNLTLSQQLLGEAQQQGEQTFEVINNLLDFAREFGDNKRFTPIPGLLERTLKLARNLIAAPSGLRFRDITIEKQYEDDLPNVPCYVSELQHVFLSLFRHSLSAMGRVEREGFTPRLRLELAFHYDVLWIKVQHNGVGLSGEEQNNLFEPYYADSIGATPPRAGERLSLSYFIITEHHKGQIAVTSDINIGTTFHLQLQLS